jgi:hypothetical protein
MSSHKIIPPLIADELERCGLPWRIDNGGKHYKLFVGDQFVGVLQRSVTSAWADKRRNLNVRSQIRRIVRGQP